MTVRLRAHHLLCVLTYVGRGYSPAFTRNMTAIAGRLARGEPARIVEGADDICRPPDAAPQDHCDGPGVLERDAHARARIEALLRRPLAPGDRIVLDGPTLARLRAAFTAGDLRPACGGCEWQHLCTEVAATGYPQALLPAR